MAVTIKELSARCGLSVSTVSKALNDYPDVSEETRKQVRTVADEMGYRANAIARSLKIGRTFNLGVLYSDDTESGFTHSYFSPVLQSFKQEAERRGYDITFITHNMGHSKMTYLEHCRYRNVDGVCIVCSHFDDSEVLQLVSSPLPLVTIDHVFNNKACVQSENRQGIEALTRYILSMGHKKVAFIYGAQDTVSDIRLTSFLRTMNDAGLSVPDDYLIASPYHDPASTREATAQLLSLRLLAACDHHDGRDQHLTQQVALLCGLVVFRFVASILRLVRDLVHDLHQLAAFGCFFWSHPSIDLGLVFCRME